MTKVLAISPHLDDAVFSAGGTLARHAMGGDEVTVLTCFTGNVARPSGFALACQLDKGLSPETDYMALRRAEDEAACAAIGAQTVHLPFLEAPHRGYGDAAALFGARRDNDETILRDLTLALAEHIASIGPELVYGPYCVGDHVDHHIVRDAIDRQYLDTQVICWEDFPYALKTAHVPRGITRQKLDPRSSAAKLRGTLCYVTQLDFQFGSPEQANESLSQWKCEGFADQRGLDTRKQDW